MEPTTLAEVEPRTGRAPRLLDLIALTLGYAFAATVFRAFWPSGRVLTVVDCVLLIVVYLWMGLAMSGPLLLFLERRRPARDGLGRPAADRPPPGRARETGADRPAPALRRSRFTWAERVWLAVGGYWIGLGIFLVPLRLRDASLLILFLLVTLAPIGLWAILPSSSPGRTAQWTHSVAIAMLITWPFAWMAMIYLALNPLGR